MLLTFLQHRRCLNPNYSQSYEVFHCNVDNFQGPILTNTTMSKLNISMRSLCLASTQFFVVHEVKNAFAIEAKFISVERNQNIKPK